MSRLSEALAGEKKKLLAYIVAGDPNRDATLHLMHDMVSSGVDAIELGVPFSDPEAEGPVIQLAHERALRSNTSLEHCLGIVRDFRKTDCRTPVILMGYLNPVESMGYERFANRAANSGVDGLIIVNLPPEEASVLKESLSSNSLDLIYLVAPTTTQQRMEMICSESSGFVYYVSLKGTTGAGNLNVKEVECKLEQLRSASNLPILVGFGIKNGETAAAIGALSDGVVVGSAIVDLIAKQKSGLGNEDVCDLLREIRQGLDELSG